MLGGGWWWYNTMTGAYHRRVHHLDRRKCPEHVQRFSSRLLLELHAWSKAGCITWSEAMSPTVCSFSPSLDWRRFDPVHIGNPFTFSHRHSLSRQQWEERLAGASGRIYFVHPLKF